MSFSTNGFFHHDDDGHDGPPFDPFCRVSDDVLERAPLPDLWPKAAGSEPAPGNAAPAGHTLADMVKMSPQLGKVGGARAADQGGDAAGSKMAISNGNGKPLTDEQKRQAELAISSGPEVPLADPAGEARLTSADPTLADKLAKLQCWGEPAGCTGDKPCDNCGARRRYIALLVHRETHGKAPHPRDLAGEMIPVPEPTGLQIIKDYLQEKYDFLFRRDGNLFSNRQGRAIARAEACAAPGQDLIAQLMTGSDFPRGEAGPKRSAVPYFFRQWAPIAWQTLVDSLPSEASSPEIAEGAARQFKGAMTAALLTMRTFQSHGGDGPECRSLVSWCERFAKPGPWQQIRSLKLWCKREKGNLGIALHHGLFGQVGKTCPAEDHRALADLAEAYGIGFKYRTGQSRFIILTPDFVSELLSSPNDSECDATHDGTRDAAIHVCAIEAASRHASQVPSHHPEKALESNSSDSHGTPSREGRAGQPAVSKKDTGIGPYAEGY